MAFSEIFNKILEHMITIKVPTTVLCFKPFLKKSSLSQFNLPETYTIATLPTNWTEFYNTAFYKIGRDFTIR